MKKKIQNGGKKKVLLKHGLAQKNYGTKFTTNNSPEFERDYKQN